MTNKWGLVFKEQKIISSLLVEIGNMGLFTVAMSCHCKELKQAFGLVYNRFLAINRQSLRLNSETLYGQVVESSQSYNQSETSALKGLTHYGRILGRWCSFTTGPDAERFAAQQYHKYGERSEHAFKQTFSKRGSWMPCNLAKEYSANNCLSRISSRSFLTSGANQVRSTINHRFCLCGTRNIGQERRFYYVDRYRVQHFRPRGPRRWIANPQKIIVIVILSSGLVITVYFSNLETVPYSHRKHFILISRQMEKQIGESQFEQMKAMFKSKILPAIHPESVRVRLIAKDIIEALERGTRHKQSWSELEYGRMKTDMPIFATTQEPWSLSGDKDHNEDQWYVKDDALDDKWVEKSRKSGRDHGDQSTTEHLEGLNWEILVVYDPMVNALCLPGGKIVVFTGLLDIFRSDSEIATVIAHEVGHAVARHAAEGMTSNLWFAILQLILLQFIGMPDVVHAMSNLLLKLPFSRRMEMEADYIGLLLMASAGYDPRVAPSVYEKLGKLSGDSVIKNYLSTHPSGKKRAEMLRQANVMQEALNIYRERVLGHGIEGFL